MFAGEQAIDVIIPCHEKDKRSLELVINGIKKNVHNVRRIIVISKTRLTNSAEWFDQTLYPFDRRAILSAIFRDDMQKVLDFETARRNRTGWIYQQFLKLYAPFVIPNISSNILVVDADTIFLKPIEFIDADGNALYGVGKEYHVPYFEHGKRLFPDFKKVFEQYSGICHHMLFQRPVLERFFQKIRSVHNKEPWIALCECIDHKELFLSSISEYELYFNYIFAHEPKVKIRPLNWKNVYNMGDVQRSAQLNFDFVSWHNYSFEIN